MDLDSSYEACLKLTGDPNKCFVFQAAEPVELEECVQKSAAVICFVKCVKGCSGSREECVRQCRKAVDAAVARNLAKDILRGAADMVIESGLVIKMPEAVAMLVSSLLNLYLGSDCATKISLFHVVGMAVVRLRDLVAPDLILLLAPLISAAHNCVGEEADDLLEEVKAVFGEQEVSKISAALDSGEVVVGRVIIRFPPVK